MLTDCYRVKNNMSIACKHWRPPLKTPSTLGSSVWSNVSRTACASECDRVPLSAFTILIMLPASWSVGGWNEVCWGRNCGKGGTCWYKYVRYVFMCVYMSVNIYVCLYVCMHALVDICIHMNMCDVVHNNISADIYMQTQMSTCHMYVHLWCCT